MARLEDLASVLRSKNAGPFQITVDILFDNDESYRRVRDSGVLTPEKIAPLYDVYGQHVFDRDVYGAQQHGPLAALEIP
jgi:hypothetical protein